MKRALDCIFKMRSQILNFGTIEINRRQLLIFLSQKHFWIMAQEVQIGIWQVFMTTDKAQKNTSTWNR